MKAILPIIALMAAPAMTAQAYGAESAGVLQGLLPTDGSMQTGVAVAPQHTQELAPLHQQFISKLQALEPEKQKAVLENYDPLTLIAYNADIWPDKAEYEKYKAEWKKVKLVATQNVAVGLKNSGNNRWTVLSLAENPATKRTAPLTISALSYDSGKNIWISNNGELTATEYSATDDHVFGAQIGHEWKLEKEDSLSKMSETIRVTKRTDGKAIFIVYSFTEVSAITPNLIIAQGGYALMIPTRTAQVNMAAPGSR